MRAKRVAIAVLCSVMLAVILNSVYLHIGIEGICEVTEAADVYSSDAETTYKKIYSDYKRHERIISLTVNHDDLANIDDLYCEIIGELEVGDADGASITKSRLIGALKHLWRLSKINIDSII